MNLIFLILILLVSCLVQWVSANSLFDNSRYHLFTFFALASLLIYFNSSVDTAVLLGCVCFGLRVLVTYSRVAITTFLRLGKGDKMYLNLFLVEQIIHSFLFSKVFFALF